MADNYQTQLQINQKVIANAFNHYNLTKDGNIAINCSGKDNKILDKDNFNYKLAQINLNRWTLGKPPLSHIICYKCKANNEHFTADCPNQICYICKGKHNTKYCKYRIECQFCDSTEHSTFQCTNEKAIKKRRLQISICYICKRKGHIASECKTNFNQIYNNLYTRRYRYINNNNNNNYYNYNRGYKNFNNNFRRRYNSYNNYNNYARKRKWF